MKNIPGSFRLAGDVFLQTHGDGSLCSYGFITNFLTDTEQIPVILLAAEW
jgi:hypothetical protein